MNENILQVGHISIRYDKTDVINDLSFEVSKGEKTTITGASGKGKSSLIQALLGFIPLQKGEIIWFGKKLDPKNKDYIRNQIAWLPQDTSLYFDTLGEMIDSLFRFKNNRERKPSEAEITFQLQTLGLEKELLLKKINEISGGQKQRLLLAAAILLKKPLLILDEPTSDLDETNKKMVADLILNGDQTVIAISHDPYWIQRSDKNIAL